ncbi:MAG: protoporphyrinogen oxidase [Candidatus Poribacteria bacterium]|nr:protoporphyrinogen oxidase [Candidatus Poribacteria bacterium]MDE0504003.1 protoporphyrinogen oxidase [Candidatus Poribacteria bacterium]
MLNVTIIGGGISGLATAYYLQEKSREHGKEVQYTLVESAPHLGGKITTERVGQFVIEGGPDLMLTQKPWGVQLCRDLGLEERLISTNDERRHTFLLQKGKLIPFPNDFTLLPTRLSSFVRSPMFSIRGKLRLGLDLFIPPRKENGDESLADFIRRRFGQETVEKIGGPLLAAIHQADPERLSLLTTFPRFAAMEKEHGSLIRAMRAQKRKQPPSTDKPPAMFKSLKLGMGELVEALARQLSGNLRTACHVTNVRPCGNGFEVTLREECFFTDMLVLAVPAYSAAELVAPFASHLGKALGAIRYVSSGTVSLGYMKAEVENQHGLNGFGFLVPKSEGRSISGCTWSSSKLSHRSPDDGVLIRVFIGGPGQEDVISLDDGKLAQLVRSEIGDILGITANPIVQRIHRWPRGRPQYDVGHLDCVSKIETLADTIPGLFFTGSAYRGSGIPDCVKEALNTVDRILGRTSVKESRREGFN